MIIIDCEQGTPDWDDARRGIPTASEFSRIVTPTGKLSASREGYIAELVAEWALGYSVASFGGNAATERGHILEPEALDYFTMLTDAEVERVGFVYRDDDRMVGCSPDFMHGNDPGELKCPENPGIHLVRLVRDELPRDYFAQCQGQIWVTGGARCHFMSYFPSLPPLYVTVEPDDAFQAALDKHIPAFISELLEAREKLIAMGVTPA